jgi:hypothetical protein
MFKGETVSTAFDFLLRSQNGIRFYYANSGNEKASTWLPLDFANKPFQYRCSDLEPTYHSFRITASKTIVTSYRYMNKLCIMTGRTFLAEYKYFIWAIKNLPTNRTQEKIISRNSGHVRKTLVTFTAKPQFGSSTLVSWNSPGTLGLP